MIRVSKRILRTKWVWVNFRGLILFCLFLLGFAIRESYLGDLKYLKQIPVLFLLLAFFVFKLRKCRFGPNRLHLEWLLPLWREREILSAGYPEVEKVEYIPYYARGELPHVIIYVRGKKIMVFASEKEYNILKQHIEHSKQNIINIEIGSDG